MKAKKFVLNIILVVTLCLSHASAVTTFFDPQNNTDSAIRELPNVSISEWAVDDVTTAMRFNFGPDVEQIEFLSNDFLQPISRTWFCHFALKFIAFQESSDYDAFSDVVLYYNAKKDAYGFPLSAFKNKPVNESGDKTATVLLYLGVVEGNGSGEFDGNKNVTRQEAATILTRVYQVYGGELPTNYPKTTFMDDADIAPWAKRSVTAVSESGIMIGSPDNNFMPNDTLSIEQCLTTLVRLYKLLPISRKNNNVISTFTYEQYISYIEGQNQDALENGTGLYEKMRIEGPVATFIRLDNGAAPTQLSILYFVYRSGGIISIGDIGICDTGRGFIGPSLKIENPYFSENGQTFCCTVSLEHNVTGLSSLHNHEAGIYYISIDVETCKHQVQRQEDKRKTHGRHTGTVLLCDL